MKKRIEIMQIFKYYAYFHLLLHRFLHFYCNMPVFAIITWKRADDDDKNENPLRRGAAHTFPPPRLAFFYFPNIPPPPLELFFVSAPFAVFFDFIINFCYNIYIKQRKNNVLYKFLYILEEIPWVRALRLIPVGMKSFLTTQQVITWQRKIHWPCYLIFP